MKDPVTGDELTLGEWVSWKIQHVMRRWWFVGLITIITAYVWIVADPIWTHPITDQWNLWASYLALLIESVTAMALINQCLRDAVVSRQTHANSERIEQIETQNAEILRYLRDQSQKQERRQQDELTELSQIEQKIHHEPEEGE